MIRPALPVLAAAALALAGCEVAGVPVLTSVAQALTLAVVVALAAAGLAWHRRDRPEPPLVLDAQPLLPGEARWVVGRDGVVLDSCTHRDEHGIASGYAVGRPIATWAPPGSPEGARYDRALEDRVPQQFETAYTGADGVDRVAVVHLQPRSDGSLYCESWDVTEYARRAEAAEVDAAVLRAQRDRLMDHATDEAVALARSHARPTP